MNVNIFKDNTECNRKLAEYLINEYLTEDKNIAISGGSTPIGLFNQVLKLTNKNFKVKSRIFWVDERCVEPTSDDSNYGSAHKNFLSKMNIPKENIFRIKGEKKSSEEAQSYTKLLSKEVDLVGNLPSFDLCILGIGGDGHTASIFPHELDKLIKINHCVVGTNPDSGQKRVSLSLNQINNSKEVIIHACGSGKREVIDEIISKKGKYLEYPASHVKPLNKKLSWYLDFGSAENFMN